jgi:hypothetical protein
MSVGGKYVTAYLGSIYRAPAGFTRIGNLIIDTNPGDGDYTAANFIGGIMSSYDSTGYIIISDTTNAGVVGRNTGNNSGILSQPDQPTFWVSPTKDDTGFLYLVNRLPARKGQTPFTDGLSASTWLRANNYWTTYITPVLSLDAANYTSGNWIDSIEGRQFTLYNSPSFSTSNGGYFDFDTAYTQYAECSTSLPDLSQWSIGVWHYYTGTNVGPGACIVTELFPGLTNNINFSLGDNDSYGLLTSGFFDYTGWHNSGNGGGYTLTPNNWYYIVGTYDGHALNLYVNNSSSVGYVSYHGIPLSSQGGIRLMSRWDNNSYWGGRLAKVDIYDGALSTTQINSIWNQNKSRFGL